MKLLIADYAATRAGIRVLLDDEHWEVCAEADDAAEAIAAADREAPDVCVIGLDLPGGAITAVREISHLRPDLAIVVLASSQDADDLLAVLRAGARGYAVPGIDAQGLQRVLRAVAAGEAAVPRSLVLELVRELQGGAGGVAGLTGREAQVLGMLRRGQSTSAIAGRL